MLYFPGLLKTQIQEDTKFSTANARMRSVERPIPQPPTTFGVQNPAQIPLFIRDVNLPLFGEGGLDSRPFVDMFFA